MWLAAKRVRTTISDQAAPCPLDRVNRQWLRLRGLRGSTPTLVGSLVGAYHVRRSASFVLDALEQALPLWGGGLVHHRDPGVQSGLKWSSQHP